MYVCICVHVCMYVMYACMYICMYVCMLHGNVFFIHTYTYTYTCTHTYIFIGGCAAWVSLPQWVRDDLMRLCICICMYEETIPMKHACIHTYRRVCICLWNV